MEHGGKDRFRPRAPYLLLHACLCRLARLSGELFFSAAPIR